MAAGDIITTQVPAPEIKYARKAGTGGAAVGKACGFDNSGDAITANASTGGPVKALTNLVNPDNNAVGYMYSGEIELEAGGTIQPNKKVVSDANGDIIERDTDTLDQVIGTYLRKVGDQEGNPSDAADGDRIIVRVDP